MSNKPSDLKLITVSLAAQVAVVFVVLAAIAFDVIHLGAYLDETSNTEKLQETFALLSALMFGWAAMKSPEQKGSLILIAGLLGCIFIRELDVVFDKIVHGAWVYPATALAALSIFTSFKNRGNVWAGLLRFGDENAFFSMGILIVLIFSRVFGTGSLWEEVLPGQDVTVIKMTVQEGLELLGYGFVFYSAVAFTMRRKAA